MPLSLQVKLNCTRDEWRLLTALLKNSQNTHFIGGQCPSSYKSHFWFPSRPCGWGWVVWEESGFISWRRMGRASTASSAWLFLWLKGGSWKCSQPWHSLLEGGGWDVPAWDVPAGRAETQIQGQGPPRAGAEPEGAGSLFAAFFKKNPFPFELCIRSSFQLSEVTT